MLKDTGQDLRQLGDLILYDPPPDEPWQIYLQKPLTTIFAEDPINFFIPLHQVRSAVISREKKGDLLVFRLPSYEEQLALDPGVCADRLSGCSPVSSAVASAWNEDRDYPPCSRLTRDSVVWQKTCHPGRI
jgi:hypothetical protein